MKKCKEYNYSDLEVFVDGEKCEPFEVVEEDWTLDIYQDFIGRNSVDIIASGYTVAINGCEGGHLGNWMYEEDV